ncbi:hypothetical protein HU200_011185 [Digitaria exilis]|uniref:Neprosin PEP catalytic domain-containing protein n=1 Tax=Digitaria exilis TaxID=1010633 RepID=A0A835KMU7_9POAL|nr:hypothetical protein HU200_011185 [Digitaria exilis]
MFPTFFPESYINQVGGVVHNSRPNGMHTDTTMGSGRMPDGGGSAVVKGYLAIDANGVDKKDKPIRLGVTAPKCYNVAVLDENPNVPGFDIAYGGAGGRSCHDPDVAQEKPNRFLAQVQHKRQLYTGRSAARGRASKISETETEKERESFFLLRLEILPPSESLVITHAPGSISPVSHGLLQWYQTYPSLALGCGGDGGAATVRATQFGGAASSGGGAVVMEAAWSGFPVSAAMKVSVQAEWF